MNKIVTVLGGGAFGTAISNVLADNAEKVYLWCLESEVAEEINSNHENSRFLPGVKLNKNIEAVNDFALCLEQSHFVFEAIPVKFLRSVLIKAKNFVRTLNVSSEPDHVWVTLSKGIEQDSLMLPFQIIEDLFEHSKIVSVGGPNFAEELGTRRYSAATVAVSDEKVKEELEVLLQTNYFRLSFTDDFMGVQISGALKNLITLLVGIAKGSGASENCIAFLVVQGLKEIAKLNSFLGGKVETVYDFCGVGDLLLTAMGSKSRNLKAGFLLGKGKSLNELENEFGTLPEGINTTKSIYQLIKKHKLDLPLCVGVYQILFEGRPFKEILL